MQTYPRLWKRGEQHGLLLQSVLVGGIDQDVPPSSFFQLGGRDRQDLPAAPSAFWSFWLVSSRISVRYAFWALWMACRLTRVVRELPSSATVSMTAKVAI